VTPRPLVSADYPWLLALSAANETETGHIDESWLEAMSREWFRASVVESHAYLISFAPGAAYASPNFLWFRERARDFVYVDRVVVAASARGQGLARLLYEDLFAAAKVSGASSIVCEVNSDPPNPGSDAFHARLGFSEVGKALLGNGKSVRYLQRPLS
jgi:predicted GNAT superfamily acetyltransferase